MSFEVRAGAPFQGRSAYIRAEYGIVWGWAVARRASFGFDSAVEFGTLTLPVRSRDGLVGPPEGYHPDTAWRLGNFVVPDGRPGRLFWTDTDALVLGGAVALASVEAVETVFDAASGWLRLSRRASSSPEGAGVTVRFCDAVLARVDGDELLDLWLLLEGDQAETRGA